MRRKIKVKNADAFVDGMCKSELFACEKTTYGLNVRYNYVFTPVGNPKIKIFISDGGAQVGIIPNPLMLLLSLAITAAFWAIAIAALWLGRGSTAAIITAFLAPSLMWALDLIFIRRISKIILPDIESVAEKSGGISAAGGDIDLT